MQPGLDEHFGFGIGTENIALVNIGLAQMYGFYVAINVST